jgi:hypothetical protein
LCNKCPATCHLAVKDSIVYLATPDSGLVVVDCHDPTNPIQVDRLLDYAVGLTAHDSFLFVIDDSLNIFDVSDPLDPVLVGMSDCRPYTASIIDMDASDSFVYWGETTVLAAIDVGDPANPRDCEMFDFGVEGEVHGVSAHGTTVAITNSSSGLWILRNNQLTLGVDDETIPVSSLLQLFPNFPNPFNPITTIRFSVPKREHITLAVFDILGRKLSNLVDGVLESGLHEAVFDGPHLSSGVYFVRLTSENCSVVKRMMLLR